MLIGETDAIFGAMWHLGRIRAAGPNAGKLPSEMGRARNGRSAPWTAAPQVLVMVSLTQQYHEGSVAPSQGRPWVSNLSLALQAILRLLKC